MSDEEPTAEERDATEVIRLVILAVGIALNVVITWDYLKDRPEVMVARQRLASWWHRNITEPARKAKALRLAEGETVFEAINIVEEGAK